MNSTYNFDELSSDAVGLFEPSEVKIRRYSIHVADTNNHIIKIFELYRKSVQYIDHQGMGDSFGAPLQLVRDTCLTTSREQANGINIIRGYFVPIWNVQYTTLMLQRRMEEQCTLM